MRTTMLFVLAASILGGCMWTEFDDLKDDAWVESTEKPDVKATDYGVGIQRGARSGDGGRLVVLGAGDATYSELVYNTSGESSLAPTTLNLKEAHGIQSISQQPILLADPASDDISLIVASTNGVAMLTGKDTLKLYQLFTDGGPDAATYVLAPGQPAPLPLVAVGELVFGAFLPALPSGVAQPSCKLVETGAPAGFKIQVRALGTVRSGGSDDVLVWDASGKLYRYPGTVFAGCTPSQAELGVVDTTFAPDQGSQILSLDATTVVLAGHRGDTGYLRVFNVAGPSPVPVGDTVAVANMRTAALLEVGSARFVITGAPTQAVDRKTSGQVQLFSLSSTGVGGVAVATFHDAQPEANQSFGRSVAALPFNGKQVIAVAANNEIFVYFRANLDNGTALYDETRQGR